MRPELLNPFPDTLGLKRAIRAARDLYDLHQQSVSTGGALGAFSRLVGRSVEASDLDAAFGAVDPETFAKRLLLRPESVPPDLTEAEMVELIERVLSADGGAFELAFWLDCVARSSGNDRIADLVFWPDLYFGSDATTRPTSAAEIVAIALRDAKSAIIALPDRS